MRLINNGTKAVQVGHGHCIEPGHEYECDDTLGCQLLAACAFVSELKTGGCDGSKAAKTADEKPKPDEKKAGPNQQAAKKTTGKKNKSIKTEEQRPLL